MPPGVAGLKHAEVGVDGGGLTGVVGRREVVGQANAHVRGQGGAAGPQGRRLKLVVGANGRVRDAIDEEAHVVVVDAGVEPHRAAEHGHVPGHRRCAVDPDRVRRGLVVVGADDHVGDPGPHRLGLRTRSIDVVLEDPLGHNRDDHDGARALGDRDRPGVDGIVNVLDEVIEATGAVDAVPPAVAVGVAEGLGRQRVAAAREIAEVAGAVGVDVWLLERKLARAVEDLRVAAGEGLGVLRRRVGGRGGLDSRGARLEARRAACACSASGADEQEQRRGAATPYKGIGRPGRRAVPTPPPLHCPNVERPRNRRASSLTRLLLPRGMGPKDRKSRHAGVVVALLVAALGVAATPAAADFPYTRPGGNPLDFPDLYLTSQVPNDLSGDGNDWKFAATPDASNGIDNTRPTELGGVRGAHVADANATANTAWKLTLGRPDVEIAVLDSGIKWNDAGAMNDLRLKVHINRGELPLPEHGDGSTCGAYDCNGDGVFNVADYANDPRVNLGDPRRNGPP